MATCTGTIKVNSTSSQTPASLPGSVTNATVSQTFTCTLGSGTTADNVDLQYVKTLSLAASTPQTIDLTSLTDIYGNAVNFARVRSVQVQMNSTTTGDTLTISPGASNGWTALLGSGSTLVMRAATSSNNSFFVITAPSTAGWVTSGTSKTLTFDPGSSTFTVAVTIQGCSA